MFDFLNINKFKKKYILPYMETHLVDHCNLKCHNCGHYCHLIEEEIFTDVEQYEKDIKEISSKISFRIIRLLGGEPLLHPKITDFFRITRENYPNSDIRIVTNGILLPTMNETFWHELNRYYIKIDVSKYPIWENKFEKILDLIDSKRAFLGNIIIANKFYEKLNEEGSADKEKSFKACHSRNALNLWNQKLYTCQACYRYYYNKKYNKNIPLPVGIDIYKATAKEIYTAFSKSDNACCYCDEISREFAWCKSKIE